MISTRFGWIYLINLCYCRVITVNNEGNNSKECCISGLCLCSSFIDALKHLKDNTIVNITSQLVALDSNVTMGLENLNNVTIFGNGATVMCSNKGSVACRFCSNIILEEITWDRCANYKFTQGIGFVNAENITISMCTFQHFATCIGTVFFMASGFIRIKNCQFSFNHIGNVSDYPEYAALAIFGFGDESTADNVSVYITDTLFHHNGMFSHSANLYNTVCIRIFQQSKIHLFIKNVTISENGGLGGSFILGNASVINVLLIETVFMHNKCGGSEIKILNVIPATNIILISSSMFAHNTNGSLKLTLHTLSLTGGSSQVQLNNLVIIGNKGTFSQDPSIGSNSIGQGTGILMWFDSLNVYIEIAFCTILNNVGNTGSIVYIEDNTGNELEISRITIVSSQFTHNYGPALYLSNCNVEFEGYSSFSNNTAQSGSAIYLAHNSQATIGNNSTLEFTSNIALLFGGALYVDLSFNCLHHGITFTHLPNNSLVLFSNNSAGTAGNSLYFSIPESCNIIRDSSDNKSIVYIPYQFTYIQLLDSVIPEISTSAFKVNLCSTKCNNSSGYNCYIGNGNMLGQSIYFNATVCDYYNNVSEPVQFLMTCTDCNGNYILSNNKILVHNGLSKFKVFTVNASSDISTNINITINLTSISSDRYKQFCALLLVKLSPCHVGYIFDASLQQCKCYDHGKDVIQCQQNYVAIKYGYWFGTVSSTTHTFSSCPAYYCDFDEQAEIIDGYFNLPKEQNDQCSSHRAGMACGECKPGYTLAYDSPECVNMDRCSPGMTLLVANLTILYWITIVVLVFSLMYFKLNISLGYFYGIIFYYSVVDILLGSNIYISIGLFQVTAILSSFTKLTPQFLGRLCFVEGLSGIDQQFIHYTHALAVFILTIAIVIAARWSMKIASIVSCCIIRVICLLLLLAYTSLASTSLQLMRPLYYHDIDGAYVYLSPSIRYFTDRHVAYGIVACVCGLFIVIGFPLLLLLQPFLRSKFNFVKIKPLLDQFQGCYKDQYHWFAAYYLICRLIIIGMAFFDILYYLQIVIITTAVIHFWIGPYERDILNKLDGIILFSMVLVITFIKSTTVIIAIILVAFPAALSLFTFLYFTIFVKCINQRKYKRISEATVRYAIA